MRRSHKVLLAFGVTLAVLVLIRIRLTQPLPFDAQVWRAGEHASFSARTPRLRMADGLIASNALRSKSRAEVIALLGEPSKAGHFQDHDLVYWLGAERSFISIDSEWLVVDFDMGGAVYQVRIVRD